MTAPTRIEATYADVLAAPEHMVAEVIDGDLYLHPRPAMPHARTTTRLGMALGGPFDIGAGGPGGWYFLDEPELHFGKQIVVPDIAGWRRERAPEGSRDAYTSIAPDWVCEVLSPSTRRLDQTRKRRIYGEAGCGHLWFIDPVDRVLEAFEFIGDRWQLIEAWGGDENANAPPFETFALQLALLWDEASTNPGFAEPGQWAYAAGEGAR